MADVNSDYDHYQHDVDNDILIIHYHGNIGSALLPRELVLAASRFKGAIRIYHGFLMLPPSQRSRPIGWGAGSQDTASA
jgi:hypothetical protein